MGSKAAEERTVEACGPDHLPLEQYSFLVFLAGYLGLAWLLFVNAQCCNISSVPCVEAVR